MEIIGMPSIIAYHPHATPLEGAASYLGRRDNDESPIVDKRDRRELFEGFLVVVHVHVAQQHSGAIKPTHQPDAAVDVLRKGNESRGSIKGRGDMRPYLESHRPWGSTSGTSR